MTKKMSTEKEKPKPEYSLKEIIVIFFLVGNRLFIIVIS